MGNWFAQLFVAQRLFVLNATVMVRAATTSRLWAALKSFWFLPSALGLFGLLLAGASVWIDRTYSDFVPIFSNLGAVTTRTVLQTIATASITVISLTYSITLVVFTLAAGNIGPRLLTGFRESTLTRLSVGVFCCTFIFAITVLNFVGDEHTPRLSALIAFLLAILSVYVLIIYVHHVSSEVLVDNEVAKNAKQIREAISGFFREHQGDSSSSRNLSLTGPGKSIKARETGYVRMVETDCIVKAACGHRCFVDLKVSPGTFVIEGMPVALVYGGLNREIEDAVLCDAIVLGPSRQPDADISFRFHLLIEIALRALSPGVNDTYTALSCIDNLSAALSQLLNKEPPASVYCDDAGEPRLRFEILDIRGLLENTLRPLRVNARGNLLVTRKLLHALRTMAELSLPRYRATLQMHIDLALTDAQKHISSPNDLKHVTSEEAQNEEEDVAT
jgi:uncharacterized membrane protein